MIVIVGLLVLVAAVVLAITGFSANTGSAHGLSESFSILGVHISGLSSGQVLLLGVSIGVAGMLGLSMLSGALSRRWTARTSQRELNAVRHDNSVLIQDRQQLSDRLDAVRAPHQATPPATSGPGHPTEG